MRLKRFAVIGIAILIISFLIQMGLLISSHTGVSDDSPVLVMYGFDEDRFPHTSFGNAVHSAGFDYVIQNKNLVKSLEIEEEISMPKGYRSRDIVFLVTGENATSALKLFDSDEDTLGFILLNPEFETNFSMEGMCATFPTHDIAIFAGNDSSVNDSKIMYERLSGEDTLYGVKYETGGFFSSECYSNPLDSRFISIAALDYSSNTMMISSPVFQIELANYLASNYGDGSKIGTTSIVVWYSLFVFSALLFVSGLILVVAQVQPLLFRVKNSSKTRLELISLIVSGVVTLLSVVAIILMTLVSDYTSYIDMGIVLIPVVLNLFMAITRIAYVIKKRDSAISSKIPSWYIWMISFGIISAFLMISLNVFGFTSFKTSAYKLIVVLIAAVFDYFSILVLTMADNTSKLLGEGGCAIFGNKLFLLLEVVPSVVLFVMSLCMSIQNGVLWSIAGLVSVIIPYVFCQIIKKRTLLSAQIAATHTILYLIILFLVA